MLARSGRAFTGVSIACLILAVATMGGYRLAGSSNPAQGHLRVAADTLATFVSGTGDDANTANLCRRATPCRNVSQAYSVTSAGGQLTALDAGEFYNFGIAHALTVDGGSGRALIISSVDGVYISAGATDVVTLRHLQIKPLAAGSYSGIRFISGKALILDDVTIEGFAKGISVEAPGPASVTITNSHIQNNGGTGIAITPSGGTVQVSIKNSLVAGNYFGIVAQDGADVSLTDSTVTGSTNIGVGCVTYGNGPCTIQTENDRLEHNYQAIFMTHGAGNGQITESLSNDAVFGNTYGIYGDFGGTLNAASFGNNRFLNNFVNGSASSSVTQM